jgi:tight adherence protein B
VNDGLIILFAGVLLTFCTLGFAVAGYIGGPKARLRKRALNLGKPEKSGSARSSSSAASNSLRRAEGNSVPLFEAIAKRFLPKQSVLRNRLARTGINITIGTYLSSCVAVAVISFLVAWLGFGIPLTLAMLIGFVPGVGLPHTVVGTMGARRKNKFLMVLPDALDLIVRGLKSGLPVTESIAAVGREMADPLGTEFRRISDNVRFGQQLEHAVWETAKRLDLQEFNFFVISMSIQRETGGNLGEALGNLSEILRGRQRMKLKIKAMSSEARASAMILGSLPFIMFGIVYVLNPGYASLLFTDPRGIMLSGAGIASMTLGCAIMAKMVRFEI